MPTTVAYTVDTGGTGDYTSLAAWDAAQAQDLVAADRIMRVYCMASGGAADTTACNLAAGTWTTDATRYIEILPAPGHEHAGGWDTSKYRLSVSGSTIPLIIYDCPYLKLRGIQIESTGSSTRTVYWWRSYVNSAANWLMEGCILRASGTSAGSGAIQIQRDGAGGGTSRIRNNLIIVSSSSGLGIEMGFGGGIAGTVACDNNTIIHDGTSSAAGIQQSNGNVVARNNIVNGFANSYQGTFLTGTDYNATDSSDNIGTGSNNLQTQTFPFANEAGGDYSLTSQLAGQNLSSDFTTDILGKMRLNWTRGAFEFYSQQSSQPVWFM